MDQYETALCWSREDAREFMKCQNGVVELTEILVRARVYLDFLQDRGPGMRYPAYYAKPVE